MDKINENQYVVHGVGNYQLQFNKSGNEIVIPLNLITEDKIIKSKNKKFLVLRHVTFDIEQFNNIMNLHNVYYTLDIASAHNLYSAEDPDKNLMMSCNFKNAKIVYISLECDKTSYSSYKLIFELDNINIVKE